MTYNERKRKACEEAIQWQHDASNEHLSYQELSSIGIHFYRLGKRYGLLREFRENGIPC